MKSFSYKLVAGGALFLASSAAFAAGSGASVFDLSKIGAALAIGLGAAGAASGQGRAASAALEGVARNPSAKGEVFVPMILSLVFMEFQALLAFAVAWRLLG